MKFVVEKIHSDDWNHLSEKAHLVVFNTNKPKEWDRIDFALLVKDERDNFIGYVTCREHDAETLYLQYGGAFPGAKDSSMSFPAYKTMVDWCGKNYKRVTTVVENDNFVYLKMAMKVGFKIVGLRYHQGTVLLEHCLEFASAPQNT